MKEFAKLVDGSWVTGNFSWLPVDDDFFMRSQGYFPLVTEAVTGAQNTVVIIEREGNSCYRREVFPVTRASINDVSKDISGVMLEFFEAKFPHTKTVFRQGNEYIALYTLQESHRREWQKMVWDKWAEYMQDCIETKSAGDETSPATGVRFDDLLMASFLGSDQWQIQPITAGAPLTGEALTDFITGLKTSLAADYDKVRRGCIVTTVEQAECEAALWHTANFIMRNIIPGE
jgi:hypothetical protein